MTITKKFKNYRITCTVVRKVKSVAKTEKLFQSEAEAKAFITNDEAVKGWFQHVSEFPIDLIETYDIEEVK